ncbi:MAG TPA: NAD-dependent epimerase/dehydratase family protein [Symbiobacteriaceae bacterium]|jgi:nucleoside-diphosphate-sugar epimerase
MPTFITGATSSIGRVLVKKLARDGGPVRILARKSSNRSGLELPGVEFVYGDVTDPEAVRQGMDGCERVCHLAAIVGQNAPEAEWWRVNRDGSRNVLQAAYDLGVKSLVQVSSLAVLGTTQMGDVADETHLPDPATYFNLYQKTKRAADDIAREFAAKGLRAMIVYPAFGYGCSWASSHPSMAEQTLLRYAAGKPVAVLGSGRNHLCLAYYKDTVRGIRLAHERGKAGDDYLLGGSCLTFPEIWDVVARVLGKPPVRRRIPTSVLKTVTAVSRALTGKSFFPPEFFEMIDYDWNFSTAKAQRELGWQMTPFADGMAATWAEYQAAGWQP